MSLAPPEEPQANVVDPGAHELVESNSNELRIDTSLSAPAQSVDSSDDHFSDAEEGSHRRLSAPPSPIPTTRVERVDDEPSYGEVPGTPAFKIRSNDAVPDEVEIIPDGQRSRSTSRVSESDRPVTPGGTPIPRMIVERVDDKPAHGEVPGTEAYEMRRADAEPDEIRQAPEEASATLECSPTTDDRSRSPDYSEARSPPPAKLALEADDTNEPVESSVHTWADPSTKGPLTSHEPATDTNTTTTINASTSAASAVDDYDEFNDGETVDPSHQQETEQKQETEDDDDDGFGDDFDDFEEGAEAGDDDDDFGDFDDGFAEPEAVPSPVPVTMEPVHDPLAHLPNLTFASLQTPQDILKQISPHLTEIFPEISLPDPSDTPQTAPSSHPILTDRSASLWSQLVAPPPLQPPNWIRSRIRRLFLVSLGVPVDLDEILPASKQKKLILPNTEPQPRDSISRLRKNDQNASSTSISSTGEKKKKTDKSLERRGPPPPPDFDANAAGLVGGTTEAALLGYNDDELKAHVERVEGLIKQASEVLEYWLARKDSAVGDKEAFEGVIENLVGFVRRNRDSKAYK